MEDGTKVRYAFERGDHFGKVIEGEIQGGHIVFQGEKYSPTGAARAALEEIRGDAYETNGWVWWKCKIDGEWEELKKLRDED